MYAYGWYSCEIITFYNSNESEDILMKILLYIGLCIVLGVSFYWIGRVIGDAVGKRQKMQNEIKQNGSKHV